MLSTLKTYFKTFNLRYYWLFLAIVAVYICIGTFNTPDYLFPVFCAFISGGVVLSTVQYRWTSLISIFVLGHIVQYPLAALIILSLSSPDLAIEPRLWPVTPAAMWAMVVGMAGLAIGSLLSRLSIKKPAKRIQRIWTTPMEYNVTLTMLLFPMVVSYMGLGFYYHTHVVADYNAQASVTFGFLGYLQYVALVGVILQLRRYTVTNDPKDFATLSWLLLFTFLSLAPSGSRRYALFAFVVSGFCYFDWGKNERKKILIFCLGATAFFLLLPILQMYRGVGVAEADSFGERLGIMIRYLFGGHPEDSEIRSVSLMTAMLGRRLADYIPVGFLIDIVPTYYQHAGFSDVGEWFYYVVPTLFRPETTLTYTYDALIMEQYGMRPMAITGGSSPMMFIGDLYHRAGWYGIFFGMIVAGGVLGKADKWLKEGSFKRTVIWVLMMDGIINLHSRTLLKFFTLMTRHLLMFVLIAYLLDALRKSFKRDKINAPERTS